MFAAFENLHKDQKLALLDGFLCGALVTVIGITYYKEYQSTKAEKKRIEEYIETPTDIMNDIRKNS